MQSQIWKFAAIMYNLLKISNPNRIKKTSFHECILETERAFLKDQLENTQ